MKLYIKQKVFSWGDKFRVYDVNGEDVMQVEGEVFTLGKKLHVYDSHGEEAAFIRQKVMSWLDRYFISINGQEAAEVVREFTFLHPKYTVNGPDWTVEGSFWEHDYTIKAGERVVASITKQWFAWGDTYEIDVAEDSETLLALCVVLVIDAVTEASGAAASGGAASSAH